MATKKAPGSKNDAILEALRAEIDECDRQIIKLLARRFESVQKIGRYKAIHNLPVVNENREAELLADRWRQASATENYSVEKIFKLILEESRQVQMKMRESLSSDKSC